MQKRFTIFSLALLSTLQLHALDNLMMTFKYGLSDLAGTLSLNKHTFGLDLTLDTGNDIKPKVDFGYLMADERNGVDYTLQLSANALYEGSEFYSGTWLPYLYGGLGYEYVDNARPGFESAPYFQAAGGIELPFLGYENDDYKFLAEVRWMQMLGGSSSQESEAALFVGFRISTGALGKRSSDYYDQENDEQYAELSGLRTPELKPAQHVVLSDTDGDGVPDKDDQCPHTPQGSVVDEMGCADLQRHSAWQGQREALSSQIPKANRHKPVSFQPIPKLTKRFTNLFESDSANMTKEGREQIRHFVENIQRKGYRYITVEGYTDNSGTFAQNITLSKKRAEKVKALMVQYGIDPEKITAVGKGSLNPIGDNDVAEGRALNRRVEVKVE